MRYSKKENVIRLKRVIESDRLALTEESLELIKSDVGEVLSDYFGLSEEPRITVVKNGTGYIIKIECSADVLKTFAAVPSA